MSKVSNYIDNTCEKFKNGNSIIYRDENEYKSITNEEMKKYINSLVYYMRDKYKNDRIAIIGSNKLEYLISFLAIYGYVGDAVLIDKEISKEQLVNIINKTNPKLIICDDEIDIEVECNILKFKQINEIMSEEKENILNNNHKGNLYLHTSGTTGDPKIVCLTEENVFSVVEELGRKWLIDNKDSALIIVPMYHIYALLAIFHALHFGCIIILEYDYKKMVDVLQKNKPTIIVGVPLMYNKIKEKIMSKNAVLIKALVKISNALLSINIDIRKTLFKIVYSALGGNYRFGTSAGSLLTNDTNKFFNDIGLPIYNAYGMTETAGPIAINYKEYNRTDSVGKILDICNVEIKNPDSNNTGEIWVKGENLFSGYLGGEEIKDELFDTGDIGYVKDNFLYVLGRKKNILIGDNGKNIAPEEIVREIIKYQEINDCNIVMENNFLKAIINTELEEDKVKAIIKKVNDKFPNYKKIHSFEITNKEDK